MIPNPETYDLPVNSDHNPELCRALVIVAGLVFEGCMTLDLKDSASLEKFWTAVRLTNSLLIHTMYDTEDETPVYPLKW